MGDEKNLENFLESYKKSIILIPVNINGNQVKLPITYSSSAAEEYREIYEKTEDYKQAFCGMIMNIATANWRFIYDESTELDFTLQNLMDSSDEDLCKVYRAILDSCEYLNNFDKELDSTIESCIERFYHVNKREYETYIKSASDRMRNSLLGVSDAIHASRRGLNKSAFSSIKQIQGIQKIMQAVGPNWSTVANWGSLVARGIPNTAINFGLSESSINAFNIMRNFNRIEVSAKVGLVGGNTVNPKLSKMLAGISNFKEIYNPGIIKAIQTSLTLSKSIQGIVAPYHKSFDGLLQYITRFEYQNKQITLTSFAKELSRHIDPFILAIGTLSYEWSNLDKYLNETAEILQKFGWWYISALPNELLAKIFTKQNELSQEDVDKIICDCLEENNFEILEEITGKWIALSYFEKRKKKLTAAIEAHKEGKYVLTIPTLTPVLEGVIREFMFDTYGLGKDFGTLRKVFWEKAEEIEEQVSNYSIMCINSLYSKFDWTNPSQTPDLNRHKICHGLETDCDNRVYSLRIILYLNEIFQTICGLKEIELH